MRPAFNDTPEHFLDRPDVILVFVWGIFLVPILGLIAWMLLSDRREKRKRAERRLQGEKVAEPGFFGPYEVGEVTPGMELTFHVIALMVVLAFLHLIPTWLIEVCRKMDPALVSNLTMSSAFTLVRRVYQLGGHLIMWWIILQIVRFSLWKGTVEAYRAYKKSREERRKNSCPPAPVRPFDLYGSRRGG